MKNAYNILVRKREGKKTVGRPRHRLEDNIKICLKETGYGLDSSVSGFSSVAGSCEDGKSEELLDQMSDY
jgi:hypothetical protein